MGRGVGGEELGADAGELVAQLGRFDDLEVGAEPGDLAGERLQRVAADLDPHPTVVLGGADVDAGAEHLAAQPQRVGPAAGAGVDRRAALLDLVGHHPPRLGEVEPLGPIDRLAGRLDRRDAVDAERPLAGVGARHQVPHGPLGGEPERVDGAGRRRPVARDVAEHDLFAGDDGVLDRVEVFGRRAFVRRAVPTRRVDVDRAGRRFGVGSEPFGQGAHELAERGLDARRRRCRPGDHEQRPRLGRGEAAQVGAPATRQPPAAVAPLHRVDGQPGDTEGVEVAAGGALGHLELGGHLGGRHLPALLEQEEDGDQTVRAHT